MNDQGRRISSLRIENDIALPKRHVDIVKNVLCCGTIVDDTQNGAEGQQRCFPVELGERLRISPAGPLSTGASQISQIFHGDMQNFMCTILNARPVLGIALTMPSANFIYRGCTVDLQVADHDTVWEITIRVTPFDGVELIEPFGTRELRLAKGDSLDLIQAVLIDEIQLAIDHRLVGC